MIIDNDPAPGENLVPLDQLSKEEFRDATRHLSGMTDAEFDLAWDEFQEEKRRRRAN